MKQQTIQRHPAIYRASHLFFKKTTMTSDSIHETSMRLGPFPRESEIQWAAKPPKTCAYSRSYCMPSCGPKNCPMGPVGHPPRSVSPVFPVARQVPHTTDLLAGILNHCVTLAPRSAWKTPTSQQRKKTPVVIPAISDVVSDTCWMLSWNLTLPFVLVFRLRISEAGPRPTELATTHRISCCLKLSWVCSKLRMFSWFNGTFWPQNLSPKSGILM